MEALTLHSNHVFLCNVEYSHLTFKTSSTYMNLPDKITQTSSALTFQMSSLQVGTMELSGMPVEILHEILTQVRASK